MSLSIGHKLSLAFASAVAILLATGIVASRNTRELVRTADLVTESEDVVGALDAVIASTADAESGVRGLLLTGDERYRRQTAVARLRLGANLAALQSRSLDTRETAASLHALGPRVESYVSRLDGLAPLQGATADARPAFEAGIGGEQALLDSIRAQVETLRAHERTRLVSRSAAARVSATRTAFIVRLGLALTMILAPLAFLIVRNDFVVRRASDQVLRESEARLRASADGSLDAFYVLRSVRDLKDRIVDLEFVDLNARAEALLGRERSEIVGQRLCELIPVNRTAGHFDKYVRVIERGEVLEEEFEVDSPDVKAAWIHHQVVPLNDGVAITSRDISERKQQEEALRSLSLIDELTGLYNRRGFLTLAQQQLKLARRNHRELLLLFVDMDDFKEINDAFGHQEGDVALTRAAAILKKTFRDSDILARIGGDEFVSLASDSGPDVSDIIVNRMRTELHERNAVDGFPYRLSFSVGVARFDPDSPPTIEELLATADSMLYEQKKQRRLTQLVGV